MKKLIIVLILSNLSLAVFSQYGEDDYKEKTAAAAPTIFEFKGVITLDSSLTKDVLYERAREWFSKNVRSSKDAIDYSDKQEGKILGSFFIETPLTGGMGQWTESAVRFKAAIYIKDGRYKYELSDFNHIDLNLRNYPDAGGNLSNEKPVCGNMGLMKKHWKVIKEITENKIDRMLLSLNESMKKNAPAQDNSW